MGNKSVTSVAKHGCPSRKYKFEIAVTMLQVYANHKVSKVKQVADYIAKDIEKGLLKKDSMLPSINHFCKQCNVSRDTIEKAYNQLKKDGYIMSVAGKGFFVKGKKENRLRILLVFNELSSYKKLLYDTFVETLGEKATVDLQLHHYNPQHFDSIIERNLGSYHYYVIMPHFFHNTKEQAYIKVLKRIPENELMLLDKRIPQLSARVMSVSQDFEEDIFNALTSINGALKKYHKLQIIYPTHTNYPIETLAGIKRFCVGNNLGFSLIDNLANAVIEQGTVYMVNVESDLAELIKKMRQSRLELGVDVGIISFNETVLKELLEITVVTTDFEHMGRFAAKMILNKEFMQVKNPFIIIKRKSV
jgi:DNA-binding transcriptional regulator YhcF (GntR family)